MKQGTKILFTFRQRLADRATLPKEARGIYIGPTDPGTPMIHSVCLEGVGLAKAYEWEFEEVQEPKKYPDNVVNDVKYVVVRLKMHGESKLTIYNLHSVSAHMDVVAITEEVTDAVMVQHDMGNKEPDNLFAVLLCVQRIEK